MITKNARGQSLIELIMVLPLFIGFWIAMILFARIFIIDIELLHTARHGVFWLAYQTSQDLSSEEEAGFVQNECADFLRAQDPSLDMDRLTIQVEAGDRWKPVKGGMAWAMLLFTTVGNNSASRAVIGKLAGVDPRAKPASVTLNYSIDTPPLFQLIPGFPPTIPLRGYCVCYR
jgi:hypothetical protein